jgi:hypothetical protein
MLKPKLLGFCFSLLVCGCDYFTAAFFDPPTPPLYTYRADVEIKHGDNNFIGVADMDLGAVIPLTFTSKVPMYFLTITTCSRHQVFSRVGKSWFGKDGQKLEFVYTPNEIEKKGNCPLYIEVFDSKGSAAWGIINFRTNETLNATASCNGEYKVTQGLTTCQTKAGLIQSLNFHKQIERFTSSGNCKIERLSNTEFLITPQGGFCLSTFITLDVDVHRAVIIGYKEILIRGE